MLLTGVRFALETPSSTSATIWLLVAAATEESFLLSQNLTKAAMRTARRIDPPTSATVVMRVDTGFSGATTSTAQLSPAHLHTSETQVIFCALKVPVNMVTVMVITATTAA